MIARTIGAVRDRVSSRLKGQRGQDVGTSLMEVIVGMAIMVVFGGMFTGAIVSMTSSSNKAQNMATTSSQLSSAFLKLDKTIRYAAAISTPGQAYGAGTTGDWYVEIRVTNTGTEKCTQYRVDQTTMTLQQRSWTPVAGAATALTSWSAMASNISNGGATSGSATVPFVFPSAKSSVTYQQLQVNLVATFGNPATSSSSSITFPALNSSSSTTSTNVCQEAGRP